MNNCHADGYCSSFFIVHFSLFIFLYYLSFQALMVCEDSGGFLVIKKSLQNIWFSVKFTLPLPVVYYLNREEMKIIDRQLMFCDSSSCCL